MSDAEARLAAALDDYHDPQVDPPDQINEIVTAILAADPTIAADLNDAPRLRAALKEATDYIEMYANSNRPHYRGMIARFRAALTEGGGE